METLLERITHWKAIGEWQKIKDVFVVAETLDRYYQITCFAQQKKKETPYHYREKTIADADFIQKFGNLDVEYLKFAQKTMGKKYPK